MDYLSGCSIEVVKAVKWIEKEIKKDFSSIDEKHHMLITAIEGVYALLKLNFQEFKDIFDEYNYIDFADSDNIFDNPHDLYYLFKMGFNKNQNFIDAYELFIKDSQTVRGFIHSNSYTHTGPMRVLVNVEPEAEATKSAVKYFIENYMKYDVDELSIGVLALFELNFHGYNKIIVEIGKKIKESLNEEGFIRKYRSEPDLHSTCLVIQSLSYIFGSNDEHVVKAINWLKSTQRPDGSWEGLLWGTCLPLLTLIIAGEGAKISIEELNRKEVLFKQQLDVIEPIIVTTIPFDGEFTIKEKIKEMIYSSSKTIWICSRFITEFWTDIITLKRENPNIDIKIITIPLKDARSKYIGDGKKFVDIAFETLQRSLESNLKTSNYLHARMVLTDDSLLISSADLSSEQLEKEINLGVWTRDLNAIENARNIFLKLWQNNSDLRE